MEDDDVLAFRPEVGERGEADGYEDEGGEDYRAGVGRGETSGSLPRGFATSRDHEHTPAMGGDDDDVVGDVDIGGDGGGVMGRLGMRLGFGSRVRRLRSQSEMRRDEAGAAVDDAGLSLMIMASSTLASLMAGPMPRDTAPVIHSSPSLPTEDIQMTTLRRRSVLSADVRSGVGDGLHAPDVETGMMRFVLGTDEAALSDDDGSDSIEDPATPLLLS